MSQEYTKEELFDYFESNPTVIHKELKGGVGFKREPEQLYWYYGANNCWEEVRGALLDKELNSVIKHIRPILIKHGYDLCIPLLATSPYLKVLFEKRPFWDPWVAECVANENTNMKMKNKLIELIKEEK